MTPRTQHVPIARRQLLHEPLKVGLALVGVAVSVALVGLLFGLREGIRTQVTTYADNVGADLYVGSGGTRNFLSASSSSLPLSVGRELREVRGVGQVEPITAWFEVLPLHDKKVVTEHVGFQPGRLGGPWEMSAGRAPSRAGEIALDRAMADDHGLAVGSTLEMGARRLRVVGLTGGTASWMAPLVFTTRRTAAGLRRLPGTATFFLVRAIGVTAETLRTRLARAFPSLSVLTREEIAANDRKLMAGVFDSTLMIMVLIALGVGAFVIGITIYGFVSERRREFGTLKAIGERNRHLYWLVSRQALALAFLGLGIGLLLQRLTGNVVETLWPKFLFVYLASHLTLMVIAAFAMALVGALVPVRVLARLEPVEVFRR